MSRPSWHRQAGLEAAVNAVRPDLDHEVRVDMMLGIALAVPGHHIRTDHEPWRARCAPHIIISSSLADVLQVRKSRAGLSFQQSGAMLRRLDGGRARAGARAGRVAPNTECARAALVGTVCRAALLFVARLNATRGPLDFGSLGSWAERVGFRVRKASTLRVGSI